MDKPWLHTKATDSDFHCRTTLTFFHYLFVAS